MQHGDFGGCGSTCVSVTIPVHRKDPRHGRDITDNFSIDPHLLRHVALSHSPSSISRPGQLDLNCVCLYQLRQPDSGLHLPYKVSNLCTHRTIECTYKTAMASQTRYYVKPSVAREFTWQSQGSGSQGIRRVNSYEYMGHFFGEHMMDRRQ